MSDRPEDPAARRIGEVMAFLVDCSDPAWPVVRHVADTLPWSHSARLRETRAFFAVRAATWDAKFGEDLPAYAAAVQEAEYRDGDVVADVGCGTGRALPALRAAVGGAGVVLGCSPPPDGGCPTTTTQRTASSPGSCGWPDSSPA
jgi:SAM-dependent methyltransferase